MRFVQQKIELNIAMQSSSSNSDSRSDNKNSLDLALFSRNEDSLDNFLESSSNFEAEGDFGDLEGHPGDFLELYFFMDNCKYHVEYPITSN